MTIHTEKEMVLVVVNNESFMGNAIHNDDLVATSSHRRTTAYGDDDCCSCCSELTNDDEESCTSFSDDDEGEEEKEEEDGYGFVVNRSHHLSSPDFSRLPLPTTEKRSKAAAAATSATKREFLEMISQEITRLVADFDRKVVQEDEDDDDDDSSFDLSPFYDNSKFGLRFDPDDFDETDSVARLRAKRSNNKSNNNNNNKSQFRGRRCILHQRATSNDKAIVNVDFSIPLDWTEGDAIIVPLRS